MKIKEALERIKKSHHIAMAMLCEGRKDDETEKAIETIEKKLKQLEEKVNHFKNVKNRYRRNQKFVEKENEKLKKAIEILKDILDIKLEVYINGGCTLNHKVIPNCRRPDERCLRYLDKEQYELLKEVFNDVA